MNFNNTNGSMKPLIQIIGLFMVSGCTIYNTVTSCSEEYQRYEDWKEHLEKATEYYNSNVNTSDLTTEEKQELEVDLIELQINVNDALFDFQDCKMSHVKENNLY